MILKICEGKKSKIHPEFLLPILTQVKKMVGKRYFFFIEEFQLITTEAITKIKYHFAISSEIINLGHSDPS